MPIELDLPLALGQSVLAQSRAQEESCRHGRAVERCSDCKVRLVSVCAALDLDEVEPLESLSRHVTFAARQTLFAQDVPMDAVFNVVEGTLRVYRLLPDGRRQVIGFALPGDFIGLSLLDHSMAAVDALSEVKACRFDRVAFTALMHAKPDLLMRLHAHAGHELSLAQDHLVLLGRRTAEERVAAFLLGLRDRYARIGQSSVTLALPMGRQDIADHLGLTIETVSRIMTRLDREHAILIVPGGVRLVDLARLESLAER